MIQKICYSLLFWLTICSAALFAQKDPILFSVNDEPVLLSEFEYIYNKTNGEKADYSRKGLDEYLDLYVKFKLKVAEAKAMELDTIPSLQQELEGYRRQLANSYLIDQEVTEMMVREAYDRTTEDVDISQIFFRMVDKPRPSDTLAAYKQAIAAYDRIKAGETFEAIAKEVSQDKTTAKRGGRIGYVTALFPKGYYDMETAAYTMPTGKVSQPIRTSAGYHLLKVHGKRPARGEMEIAHILIRKNDKRTDAQSRTKADSLHQLLVSGSDFKELAKAHSEDSKTAGKGGYLGFINIGRYAKDFEDAVFAIKADNTYSKPIESSVGFHIVKRISKRNIQPYEQEKARLVPKVKASPRFDGAKDAMVVKIKREEGFREKKANLQKFVDGLDESFLTFRWEAPTNPSKDELFTIGKDFKATTASFVDFLSRSSRSRLKYGQGADIDYVVGELYQMFVSEQVLKYAESRLEDRYDDFKSLMREYEEGILLFEATKIQVWDKASQDTTGLQAFHEKMQTKYQWEERARTSLYRLNFDQHKILEDVRTYAMNHSPEETLAKFNKGEKAILFVEERKIERGRALELGDTAWKVGALSKTDDTRRGKALKFYKIEEILPPGQKTLKEARGYVVADYQDQLDRAWIEQLRKKYKVDINYDVFESIVKD